jgi:hypothetical protein
MRRLLLISMLLISGTAIAGPPADGVCGELKGATPGLFGLCVAFCEAQDLGQAPESKQSAFSLLAAYEARRGPEDPDMPCLDSNLSTKPQPPAASCTCWSTDDLAAAIPEPTTCSADSSYIVASQNSSLRTSYAILDMNAPNCTIQDTDGAVTTAFYKLISDADAQGCAAVLASYIEAKNCL